MPLASLTLLTPLGALVALAALVPLVGLAIGEQRVRRVRELLRLAPAEVDTRTLAVALAAVPILLGIAAAQPAVRTLEGKQVRADVEALFVLDTSRSMAAAERPGGPTRLERAQTDAIRLRGAIPDVPAGVATLTDRVLPNLLPVPDAATFNSTVAQAVGIERPPPAEASVVATSLVSLGGIAQSGYFSPGTKTRLLVLLTDGESQPFAPSVVARELGSIPLLIVHVWRPGEQVFGPGGKPEAAYREDPRSADVLAALAAETRGAVVSESRLGDLAAALRRAAGAGPTAERGRAPKTRPLAPFVAAAALVPLAFVLRRRNVA